jgi:methyl-accepting chemotaxis protein
MNKTSKLSIRRTFQIIQGIVGLLLIFLVIQGVVLWSVCNQGMSATSGLVSEGLPSLRHMASLRENLVSYRLRSYELMFVPETERSAKGGQADALDKQNRELLGKLKQLFPEGEGFKRAAAFEGCLTNYVQAMGRLRGQLDKDFTGAMQALDKEIPALVKVLDDAAEQFTEHCATFASSRASQTVERFATIRKAVWGLGSASIAFAALVAVLVTLSSSRIQKALTHLVERLARTSDQVHGSANLVAGASQNLAEGAGKQAASLEETSASLEEMASMTKRNAENAKGAKESANQSRNAAQEGAETTHRMSESMEQIQASGQAMRSAMNEVKAANNEVSKIIKTIDEIAFQTNILALNAAVEAARAGEAGLGFAVVADEVRNLAQKSAVAARDTANKIESAIERSERGTKLSEQMAESLKAVSQQAKLMETSLTGIVEKAQQVDAMVADIATASVEQNQGIEQVNLAVTEMDKVTQSNAASAEESASASTDLRTQAADMLDIVTEISQLAGCGQQTAPAQEAAVLSKPEPSAPKKSGNGAFKIKKSNGVAKATLLKGSQGMEGRAMDDSFKDF